VSAIANDIVLDFDRQTLECEIYLLEKKFLLINMIASAGGQGRHWQVITER